MSNSILITLGPVLIGSPTPIDASMAKASDFRRLVGPKLLIAYYFLSGSIVRFFKSVTNKLFNSESR